MKTRISFYSLLLLLLIFAYVAGFCVEYMLDPLGRSPVLDGGENIGLAQQLSAGEFAEEPFYRAMLYPWLLSFVGTQTSTMAALATCFGVLCHLLNVLLVGLLARRLWASERAGWFASVLYAMYPVALYFSVQVLDITLGMTLFLAAIYAALRACSSASVFKCRVLLIVAGLLGGACVLTRPNFLVPLLLFPLLPTVLYFGKERMWLRALLDGALLLVAFSLPLLGQGLLNQHLSGSFRILPWQGGYNLYAANHATANGKFFTQTVSFDEIPSGMNPTRMESEYLYRQAKGTNGRLDIDAMNSYWKAQLWEDIVENPWRWFGLMGRKAVYVVNDWEQYNNLTYAYHKARFTLLQWNPLGWGVLCLAALGALVLRPRELSIGVFVAFFLLIAAYTAGLLLFFASARFRLPLAPLLCVCAGGLGTLSFGNMKQIMWRRYIYLCAGLLVGGILIYGDWWNARDDSTFIQDELLLANASTLLGEDEEALKFAEAVLVRDSSRDEARRIQVASLFNLWLVADSEVVRASLWQRLGAGLLVLRQRDASSLFIDGVYAWRLGDHATAKAAWREALRRFPNKAISSAKALQAVGVGEYFDSKDSGVEQLRAILGR